MSFEIKHTDYMPFEYMITGEPTKINIPYGIPKIRNFAFTGYMNLTDVQIPDTVTEIGEQAFGGCTGLTKMNIPASVEKIGNSCFGGCSSIKHICLPNNVNVGTHHNGNVFGGCTNLVSITCPDYDENTEVTVDNAMFAGCGGNSNLVTVEIPYGTVLIADGAFGGCTSLAEVKIPPTVKHIGNGDSGGNNVFGGCTALTSITIPASVETIISGTFGGTGLTEIIIDKSEGSIEGAPWGATDATVTWLG